MHLIYIYFIRQNCTCIYLRYINIIYIVIASLGGWSTETQEPVQKPTLDNIERERVLPGCEWQREKLVTRVWFLNAAQWWRKVTASAGAGEAKDRYLRIHRKSLCFYGQRQYSVWMNDFARVYKGLWWLLACEKRCGQGRHLAAGGGTVRSGAPTRADASRVYCGAHNASPKRIIGFTYFSRFLQAMFTV